MGGHSRWVADLDEAGKRKLWARGLGLPLLSSRLSDFVRAAGAAVRIGKAEATMVTIVLYIYLIREQSHTMHPIDRSTWIAATKAQGRILASSHATPYSRRAALVV